MREREKENFHSFTFAERHKEEVATTEPTANVSENKYAPTLTEDYTEIADEEGDYSTPASTIRSKSFLLLDSIKKKASEEIVDIFLFFFSQRENTNWIGGV